MSNVHGLFSDKKDDDDDSQDDKNNRFVGGIGDHGGGSGLAVEPNNDENPGNDANAIFGMAKAATGDEKDQVRRTITMYRGGFTVDDGPYRRLDDPANGEFLRALATGRTPPELAAEDVVVGLIDKRGEEYVEKFQSFSGAGESLGSTDPSGVVFSPNASPPTISESDTRIAVRLTNGKRHIVKLQANSHTVGDLAAQLPADGPFRLVSGFPPQPLMDASVTIEAAGLKGAQVSMQAAEDA